MIFSNSNGGYGERAALRLPRHIVVLGIISFLTAMSSSMIYGLLPVFLIKVLHSTMAMVGFIEGLAEATTSLTKIASGVASDWLGRRKPIVLLGYALSAVNKVLFPLAGAASTVLVARVIDRIGKGTRDAPRDAFLTDVTPAPIRGSGFGLRLTFYTTGFVVGPLTAIELMNLSGDNFRLVFWVAVIPAAIAIIVLLIALKEPPRRAASDDPRLRIQLSELSRFPNSFWWALMVATLLSLARFSQAFLVLKTHDIGIDAAYVAIILVIVHLVYAVAAYPFGILADHIDRRVQLGMGALILMCSCITLATADTLLMTIFGAALWGLQMAVTTGLLSASVADAAPDNLRGTAFGIYEMAVGLATFVASTTAGILWMVSGPVLTFGISAMIAATAVLTLLLRPMPNSVASGL